MATNHTAAFAAAFGVYDIPESARWHDGHLLLLWDDVWHDLGTGFKLARVRRLCERLNISLEFPWSGRPAPGEVVLRFYAATIPRPITTA